MLKIVAISDTHNRHNRIKIPKCDILIHAGDWTFQGKFSEVIEFADWLEKQPAKHIVVIPGNHEKFYEAALPMSREWITERCPRANVLINESVNIEGINIYGSPVTLFFFNWAWNKYPDEIKPYWDAIPDNTDILVTHGQPYGINDGLYYASGDPTGEHVGCHLLKDRIKELKNLKIYIGGHLHGGYNHQTIDGVDYYNAAICDDQYQVSNDPWIIDYDKVKS